MKKYQLVNLFFLFTLAVTASGQTPMPTDFYRLQLQRLQHPAPPPVAVKPQHAVAIVLPADDQADLESQQFVTVPDVINNPEQLVELAEKLSPEVEKQQRLLRAARFNLSQTRAIEPVIEQFARFIGMSPLLVPLGKEHPYPGISALKLEIADLISAEAEARMQLTLVKTALKARILACQLLQIQKKIALVAQNIELYLNLKETSDSLYRNGRISLAELTMVANEARKYTMQKNRYEGEREMLLQNIYALLNGRTPQIRFSGRVMQPDFSGVDQKASLQRHPELAAEHSVVQRLFKMTSMLERMSFPEFTGLSAIPAAETISVTGRTAAGNLIKDSNIEFNRVFSLQLRERMHAAQARVREIENRLKAELTGNLAALSQAEKNLGIIRDQMKPELEKAFVGVKSRYENGKAGFQELIEIESRLLAVKNSLIEAGFSVNKLHAEILAGLGITSSERGREI